MNLLLLVDRFIFLMKINDPNLFLEKSWRPISGESLLVCVREREGQRGRGRERESIINSILLIIDGY